MSSHREAPEISQDPVADNTDVYAFRSPDNPSTVTIVANYLPGQAPAGGPNFYEFGEDVLYEIHIDNDGDGEEDITYSFEFSNVITNPNTFLYNTGPIGSLTDPNWIGGSTTRSRAPTAARTRCSARTCRARRATSARARRRTTRTSRTPRSRRCRPARRSSRASATTRSTSTSARPSTSATLRPFQNLHLISMAASSSVDTLATLNVHSIVIQVPISKLTKRRLGPDQPDELEGRARHLRRAPAAARCGSCTTTAATSRRTARGSRSRASATRCSTRSSSR